MTLQANNREKVQTRIFGGLADAFGAGATAILNAGQAGDNLIAAAAEGALDALGDAFDVGASGVMGLIGALGKMKDEIEKIAKDGTQTALDIITDPSVPDDK